MCNDFIHYSWQTEGWKWNLQTSSSACPWCHGLTCPRPQPHSCSQSPCPGDCRRRCSCAGTPLVPWSGRRVTGSADGFQRSRCAQGYPRPPCHPPDATVLLHRSKNRGEWCHPTQPSIKKTIPFFLLFVPGLPECLSILNDTTEMHDCRHNISALIADVCFFVF